MLLADSDGGALEHSCAETRLYALTDVTVWVRVFKDGRLGGVRDSKRSISREARQQVGAGDDVVCGGCGWTGVL